MTVDIDLTGRRALVLVNDYVPERAEGATHACRDGKTAPRPDARRQT